MYAHIKNKNKYKIYIHVLYINIRILEIYEVFMYNRFALLNILLFFHLIHTRIRKHLDSYIYINDIKL